MNEIYKKLTTIKFKKLKLKKIFKKLHFIFQELIFGCLKKNLSDKVYAFINFVHINVQKFGHMVNRDLLS